MKSTALFLTAALLIGPSLDAADPYLKPLNPPAEDQTQLLLQSAEQRAAEEAAALLKIYEQEDFDVMRGVVYEPSDTE